MSNNLAALLTTFLSFVFAALSFYIIEPILAGKKATIFGTKMDLSSYLKPLFWLVVPLVLVTLVLMVFSPKVGTFEQSLTVESLNQAQTKMQQTRANVDQARATDYNVTTGSSLIGDSVALRASEYLKAVIPTIDIDASVSRNLQTGMEVYNTSISNHVLKQNVIIALGTNPVDDFKEELDKLVTNLPKGHRLILVTPYDGRVAGDANSISVQTRQYELELAEKYDYVSIADWYQVALENPDIWLGTDNVHFGSNAETIKQGGELYANTIKTAIEKVENGPVKP
ncbi:Acyltransferase family [Streptococcus sp. DD10]|nr:Acyltransferase family [Streptococcus sp. DD10]